jgi:hypothetical protein
MTLSSAGLDFGIDVNLSGLSARDKKQLIKFIGRVSEASYRRGFQQGAVLQESGAIEISPHRLRYSRDIDKAPWGENGKDSARSAVDILDIEYGFAFNEVGLRIT